MGGAAREGIPEPGVFRHGRGSANLGNGSATVGCGPRPGAEHLAGNFTLSKVNAAALPVAIFSDPGNYTLEITDPPHHPRYLSTLSLSMAAPIYVSPLVSPLINAVGFEAVYFGVVALLLLGWLLSFGLIEPRAGHRPIVLAEETVTE